MIFSLPANTWPRTSNEIPSIESAFMTRFHRYATRVPAGIWLILLASSPSDSFVRFSQPRSRLKVDADNLRSNDRSGPFALKISSSKILLGKRSDSRITRCAATFIQSGFFHSESEVTFHSRKYKPEIFHREQIRPGQPKLQFTPNWLAQSPNPNTLAIPSDRCVFTIASKEHPLVPSETLQREISLLSRIRNLRSVAQKDFPRRS